MLASMPATVTRFAPSPTGYLHLGHAYCALFAARQGQRFLVRLEDLDPVRCKPDFADAILQDLTWLGLQFDPKVRRQSQHLDHYRTGLDRLTEMGLLYPCFCTRKDIENAGHAPHGPDGPLYPGPCRALSAAERADRLALGQPFALRLDMARATAMAGPLTWRDLDQGLQTADPALFGDVVLARKDVAASYHLAVTMDDALQEIDLVTRGQDLFAASHVHRLLQALLDLPVPVWRHHRLLTDEQGRRYAKRDQALTLRSLRHQGARPSDILARLGL